MIWNAEFSRYYSTHSISFTRFGRASVRFFFILRNPPCFVIDDVDFFLLLLLLFRLHSSPYRCIEVGAFGTCAALCNVHNRVHFSLFVWSITHSHTVYPFPSEELATICSYVVDLWYFCTYFVPFHSNRPRWRMGVSVFCDIWIQYNCAARTCTTFTFWMA